MTVLQEVVTRAAVVQPEHSHAVVTMWALGVLVVAEALMIGLLLRKNGGLDFLAVVPITPLRSLVAILLFPAAVIGVGVIGYATGVWPPEYIMVIVMGALTAWSGIEVTGVWLKRRTTDKTMPTRQNIQSGIAAGPAIAPPAAPTSEMQVPADEVPVVPAQPAVPPALNAPANERGDD